MHRPLTVRIKTSAISLQLSPFNFRSGDWEVGRAIFAPLLRFGADFTLRPHLLEDWQLADDYRLVVFRLRPDLVFHNGRPVSAVDLAYSLERGCLPGARPSFRQLLAEVRRIEVMDRLTVQIALARPNRMFPAYFTRAALSLVPQEALQPGDPWRWRHLPVGCGPYQVAALSRDGLRLRRLAKGGVIATLERPARASAMRAWLIIAFALLAFCYPLAFGVLWAAHP